MPFISVASNPDLVYGDNFYNTIYSFFNFKNANTFIIASGFVLIGFYLFRAFYTIGYTYLSNLFVAGRFHLFSYRLFQHYISLPYQEFTNRTSAILTKTIFSEVGNLTNLIQQSLIGISEIFTILFIYCILIAVDWKMTLILTFILSFKVILLTNTISKVLKRQGIKRSELENKFYSILSETFGNFKVIKLIGNEKIILNNFYRAGEEMAHVNILNGTLSQLPRGILETMGFSILISIIIFFLYKDNNAAAILPIISMYALALYRMLPALNRIMNSYTSVAFNLKALEIIYNDLTYPIAFEGSKNINFLHDIKIDNISFSYSQNKPIIKNISVDIQKGERVAIIGESGNGKSTLIDLIIGVYTPDEGKILIDGVVLNNDNIKSWRSKIGYIPQTIYLFAGTISENVAFGHPMDEERVIRVLKQANMYEFLQHYEGLSTHVGEGGIKLSGGQKQRIGIARALYSDPEILVLDEATSSLDIGTESKIMDEIYDVAAEKTLIVIAHRLSTIARCDTVYQLQNGMISVKKNEEKYK